MRSVPTKDQAQSRRPIRQAVIVCIPVLLTLAQPEALRAQTAPVQLAQARTPSDCKLSRVPVWRIGQLIIKCFSDDQLSSLKSVFNQRREKLARQDRRAADSLARIAGVNRDALAQLFRIVSERAVEPEELPEKLAIKLRLHRQLVDDLHLQLTRAGRDERWPLILSNVEQGRYDVAISLAVSLKDDLAPDTGANPQGGNGDSLTAAAAESAIGKIALIQSNYVDAVRQLRAAAELASEDEEMHQQYQEAMASALYLRTEDEWNEGALVEAADLYKQLIRARPRSKIPELWAQTQERLGNVLLRLGVGRRSVSLLDDAVAAFRAALEVRTKGSDPRLWFETQRHFASALFRLGVHKGGTQELHQSVAAYRRALAEITPESAPEDWATLQNGLGAALWSLGNREDGTEPLQEAAAAFTDALEGLDAERHPRDWGATQNNLGAALFALAERETGTRSLERAIAAFHASLAAYQEASAPYFIVGVRKNLESAETMLKERQSQQSRPGAQ